MGLEEQKIIELFYKMLKARIFEERIAHYCDRGKIKGNFYLASGQEAVSAGCTIALNGKDKVFTNHRNLDFCIALELDMEKMILELIGEDGGYAKGKGGPFYFKDDVVCHEGLAISPARNVGLALGAALAEKLNGSDNIVVSVIGDGASNEGTFSESLNLASKLKLPMIFLVINNFYDKDKSFDSTSTVKDIALRAKGYSMPGIIVDGNNVLEVYEAFRKASKYTRAGKGPILIEAKTYRYYPHTYKSVDNRPKEELDHYFMRDPINLLGRYLVNVGAGNTNDLNLMKENATREVSTVFNKIFGEEDIIGDIIRQEELIDDSMEMDDEEFVIKTEIDDRDNKENNNDKQGEEEQEADDNVLDEKSEAYEEIKMLKEVLNQNKDEEQDSFNVKEFISNESAKESEEIKEDKEDDILNEDELEDEEKQSKEDTISADDIPVLDDADMVDSFLNDFLNTVEDDSGEDVK